MVWLELIVGWSAGATLLALLAGRTMSGMSRIAGDQVRQPLPSRPVRARPAVGPVVARHAAPAAGVASIGPVTVRRAA